jgi:succinoglycan biosynthesis protein ExoA
MSSTSDKNVPFVSVIMPIRNECDFIVRSLGAATAQEYPSDRMEVLVVDGMSTDGTRAIVESWQAGNKNVKLLDNPAGIVSTAMNIGIKASRGEIIVRVDGHTIISPDYVHECVMALRRSGAENVGGKMEAVGEGAFGKAIALATSSPFGIGGGRFHYSQKEELVDTVYMGSWPRFVFDRIGFFDEQMVRNQDDELNYRLRDAGGRILLSPRIRSTYYTRTSVRSLWSQYFQYGYWKVRVIQLHPRQKRVHHFVPATFVVCALALFLLAPFHQIASWSAVGLWIAYSVAVVVAMLLEVRKTNVRIVLLLPVAFASLHISYGLGFLLGISEFAMRGRLAGPFSRPKNDRHHIVKTS